MTLDDDLLNAFMETFYGFGTYEGAYWFVGMEEGGGNSIERIAERFDIWDARGRLELEDLVEHATAHDSLQYFGDAPKLQPTWNKLVRILLSAEGHNIKRKRVRRYQGQSLGRTDGNNCLLELLPLQAPSTGHWPYADHTGIDFLVDRETYRSRLAPQRANHIRQRASRYRPAAVVFYSMNSSYRRWWRYIAQVEFTETQVADHRVFIGQDDDTVYAITQHPVAVGVPNAYFHEVGTLIASL